MTLLTIVQDAMVQVGLKSPTIAFTSTDDTVQHFVRMTQVEGDALTFDEYDWPQLKTLASYTGDGTATTFDLPVDFMAWLPGHAFWLNGQPRAPLLMVTDEIMIEAKAAALAPIRPLWHRVGTQIELYPALGNGDIIKTQYFSEYWVQDVDGTTIKPRWVADTDNSMLPARLITLGAVWRYKHARGLDYAEDFRSYRIAVMQAMKAAASRPVITMAGVGRSGSQSDPLVVV